MNHTGYWPLVLVVLGLLLGLIIWHRSRVSSPSAPRRSAGRRTWHPRTPDDCAACRAAPDPDITTGTTLGSVRPWSEVKGRRGAPKRLATAGHACPSPACPYYGIADERVHALVGYGHHGATDRIQDFRCQACGTKVSARHGTALAGLKTPPARVGEVLSALAEGLDVAAAVRVFGHGEGTIARWQVRAARQAARLHDRLFRGLHLPYVQLDEIRTRLRSRRAVLWLWIALDPVTKLVPAVHLGPRTQASAHALIHALAARLRPGCVPLFTSDGLRLYSYALTAHFGRWLTAGRHRAWQVTGALLHGQVRKVYRRQRIVRVLPRVAVGTPERLTAALRALGFSGRVNTAFVERANLTLRQSVAALARRTWATAQSAPGLARQVAWWRGYYHFVRPHHSLRVPLAAPRMCSGRRRRYRARTPAMAAGIATHRWTVAELLAAP